MALLAVYQFNNPDVCIRDSALGNGEQNGIALNGAYMQDSTLFLDGCNDFARIFADNTFQLGRGTIEIAFAQTNHVGSGPNTVLSRDYVGETAGGFRVEVMPDGAIVVTHETNAGSEIFATSAGFVGPSERINLSYSWDEGGVNGRLFIDNLASGANFSTPVPNTVTMDMGCASQPWIIGAGQADTDAGSLSGIDQHFSGEVYSFSVYDSIENLHPDGIVDGTSGDDLIDLNYVDIDGDRIDAGDAILPGAGPNDDIVMAGDGNDTVFAGLGDDLVFGGNGDDLIYGGAGDDTVYGGDGNDTIFGGDGNNFLDGGAGRDTFHPTAGDTVNGGYRGDDHDTLDLRGLGPLRVVDVVPDIDGNGFDGRVELFDNHGNVTGEIIFKNIEEIVPCFTPGTLIATPTGERPVEDLRAGDKVITRDNGIQEIRWWGRKDLSYHELALNPHLMPVMIRQGSLGNGLPERDMVVSPNHRILVANDRTALYFDEHEVLVAAKHLVAAAGMGRTQSSGTSYIHFMCDRHEVVLSNGAWTETFQPGDYTLAGMGNAQRSEIFELFPELKTEQGQKEYVAARKTLRRYEAALLAR